MGDIAVKCTHAVYSSQHPCIYINSWTKSFLSNNTHNSRFLCPWSSVCKGWIFHMGSSACRATRAGQAGGCESPHSVLRARKGNKRLGKAITAQSCLILCQSRAKTLWGWRFQGSREQLSANNSFGVRHRNKMKRKMTLCTFLFFFITFYVIQEAKNPSRIGKASPR